MQAAYPTTPALKLDGTMGRADFPQNATTTVHFDSRARSNPAQTSSYFSVDVPIPLYNVASAVLVSAEIPLSYYVFSASRGTTSLTVKVDSTTQTVTIPDGNYTTTTIGTALKTALDAAFPGTTFTVTTSPATQRTSITASSGTLSVDTTTSSAPASKFSDWGLGYYLGFTRGSVLTNGNSTITGTRVASMSPENYVLMSIEQLNAIAQSGPYGRDTFAKIPLDGNAYQYSYYDKLASFVHPRPAVAKLARLTVELMFYDGSRVDLNGGEWSFSLEFNHSLARV